MPSPFALNAKVVNLLALLMLGGAGFFAFTQYTNFTVNAKEFSVQETVLSGLKEKQQNLAKLNLPNEKIAKKNYGMMVDFLKSAGLTEISDEKEVSVEAWGLKSKSLNIKVPYDKTVEILGLVKQQGWAVNKLSKKDQFVTLSISVTVLGDK